MSETMTKSDGNCHEVASVGAGPTDPAAAARPPADAQGRRMRINWLDRMAVKRTATGTDEDLRKLYGLVEETMNALSLEPDATRLRLLSRTIAGLRAKVELLEGLSDKALCATRWRRCARRATAGSARSPRPYAERMRESQVASAA
jgi:hypothetical protein